MFKDFDDFVQKCPTKEAREAALKEMPNEEIDELAFFCEIVQGKLYLNGFKKRETIFRYELADAWHMPICWVEIIDGPEAVVRYTTETGKVKLAHLLDTGEFTEEIRLPLRDLVRIRRILDDDRLFETEELEHPYHMMVLDGYNHDFEVSSKGRHIKAYGSNIQECRGMEHCLHSILMKRVLIEIGGILIPLGAPEECFLLARE